MTRLGAGGREGGSGRRGRGPGSGGGGGGGGRAVPARPGFRIPRTARARPGGYRL